MALKGASGERARWRVELDEKTLGIIGFGRIGQLVAQRAVGLQCACSRSTRSLGQRYQGAGGRKAASACDVLRARGLPQRCTCRRRRTRRRRRRGVDREDEGRRADLDVARGGSSTTRRSRRARFREGRGRGLDVFPSERAILNPLFTEPANGDRHAAPGLLRPTRRPTAPATVRRAGRSPRSTAGWSRTTVNIPAIGADDMEVLGPFVPLADEARAARARRSPGQTSAIRGSSSSASSPSSTRTCSRSPR